MAKTLRPKIDSDLMFFLPTCTKEQDNELDKSIVKHGVLDAIKVWRQKGVVVDGHRRLASLERIGQKNLKYKIECLDFDDIAEVKAFMAAGQAHRRNLTKEQIDYYMGHEYLGSKKPHGDAKRLENADISPSSQNDNLGMVTAEKIAQKHDVSAATVMRNAEYAKAVDASHDRDQILNGTAKKTKAEVIANAPVKCDKCIRLKIDVKDCPQCAIAREKKKKAKSAKPEPKPKSGEVIFDWSVAEADVGRVIRIADAIARAYPKEKNGPAVAELMSRAKAVGTQLAVMKKKLTHS